MRCLSVGDQRIGAAVAKAFLDTVAQVGIEAALPEEIALTIEIDTALAQSWMRVGKSPYETERSERSYNNYQ
jgi:hypothetical protein